LGYREKENATCNLFSNGNKFVTAFCVKIKRALGFAFDANLTTLCSEFGEEPERAGKEIRSPLSC